MRPCRGSGTAPVRECAAARGPVTTRSASVAEAFRTTAALRRRLLQRGRLSITRCALPAERSREPGSQTAHAGGDADGRLDTPLQLLRQALTQGVIARRGRLALDLHRELIQVRRARHLQLVVRREALQGFSSSSSTWLGNTFTPRMISMSSVAAGDFRHASHGARRRRQQRRQVARAVTNHRQRLLGERREHEFTVNARRAAPPRSPGR